MLKSGAKDEPAGKPAKPEQLPEQTAEQTKELPINNVQLVIQIIA